MPHISPEILIHTERLEAHGSCCHAGNGGLIMKLHAHGNKKRSEYFALMPVVALLAAATLAKVSAATQLFHLVH